MIYCQGLGFYFTPSNRCGEKCISHPSLPWLIIHLCHCHSSEINVVSLLNLPGMFLISVNQSQLYLSISTWEYSQHNLYLPIFSFRNQKILPNATSFLSSLPILISHVHLSFDTKQSEEEVKAVEQVLTVRLTEICQNIEALTGISHDSGCHLWWHVCKLRQMPSNILHSGKISDLESYKASQQNTWHHFYGGSGVVRLWQWKRLWPF